MNLIKFLADFFGIDWGVMHLKHGKHSIFIPTKIEPEHIWVSMSGHGTDGCANSSRNYESHIPFMDGIDFKFDIGTEHCKVEWFVIGE